MEFITNEKDISVFKKDGVFIVCLPEGSNIVPVFYSSERVAKTLEEKAL